MGETTTDDDTRLEALVHRRVMHSTDEFNAPPYCSDLLDAMDLLRKIPFRTLASSVTIRYTSGGPITLVLESDSHPELGRKWTLDQPEELPKAIVLAAEHILKGEGITS